MKFLTPAQILGVTQLTALTRPSGAPDWAHKVYVLTILCLLIYGVTC